MAVSVHVQPSSGSDSEVEYRWDLDTDILTAHVCRVAELGGGGGSGAMEIEGRDGSWLVLDLQSGTIRGVEIAVWPRVLTRRSLAPPASVSDARVRVRGGTNGDVLSIETNTVVQAESDEAEATLHFRLGRRRPTRTVRIAREILLDIDEAERLAGVWLLGVPPPLPPPPPFPTTNRDHDHCTDPGRPEAHSGNGRPTGRH